MRTLFVLTAIVFLSPLAMAKVWTTVYRDIMVGTHLVIVVSSDTAQSWVGALLLPGEDVNDATLSGRGYNPDALNYDGSCLKAAGSRATVMERIGTADLGFEYNNYIRDAAPGDWFVFDYRAEQAGLVGLGVYGGAFSLDVPTETLSFTHVASRDFNGDRIVNFEDLALLGRGWRSPVAPDANSAETRFDLETDGRIDIADLALFAKYWLERADCNEPATDPNNSPPAL